MSKAEKVAVISRPDKVCTVCGRVLWGAWQALPFDKGRHEDCALGSEAWLDYFKALSPAEKTKLEDFFAFSYPQAEDVAQGEECKDTQDA